MTDTTLDIPESAVHNATNKHTEKFGPVAAHLLDGRTLRGSMKQLNAHVEILTLSQDRHKDIVDIPFAELRYVIFETSFTAAQTPYTVAPLLAVATLPGTSQTFHIMFNDGISIDGKTRGSFIDNGGLHLFKPSNNHTVTQMFVPLACIKNYQIGAYTDKNLAVSGAGVTQGTTDQGMYLLANAADNNHQLRQILDGQRRYITIRGEPGETKKLGQILIDYNQITPQDLEDALQEQISERGKKLGEYLRDKGIIGEDQVNVALARKLNIPFVNLGNFDIDPKALACLPQSLARQHTLIPLCFYNGGLVIAMDDPTNTEAIENAQFVCGYNVELAKASRSDITNAISEWYEDESDMDEDITTTKIPDQDEELTLHEAERLGKEKPIVRLVNRIIIDAIRRRASDIHIRPLEDHVDLLLRIDGMLIKVRRFHKRLLPAVTSRIKILGRMNIAERRIPQDGRSKMVDNNSIIDLRISIIPTVDGESVVIRLLNTEHGLKSIGQLGFNDHDMEIIQDLLHKSYGMILVTGPTGSGKSTTLYATLQELIKQNVNIITVEDPVEYHVSGIEQIQVNTAPGYTFAKALRHIVRHDPDVIMIGEIRDHETCKIAIESALTGHLVISTLHTNDAAGAVTRLVEMGIEAFLLNATLLGILAQRLVRRNCPQCMQQESPDPSVRKVLGVTDDEIFYKGTGCEHCNNTGYSGRMAVYELLTLSPKLHRLIQGSVSSDTIRRQAIAEGMVPLTQNALSLARQRATSLAEVYRVRLE